MARKQDRKTAARKPAKPAAAEGPPEGYWRAPTHGYQWPAPGEVDGAQIKGGLADIDTAASEWGEAEAKPALVVYVDGPTRAFDVGARKVVTLTKGQAVRVLDPCFAKFAQLLEDQPRRRFAHLIVTLRFVPWPVTRPGQHTRATARPRFVVDVGTSLVLAPDYGAGPDAAAPSPPVEPATATGNAAHS